MLEPYRDDDEVWDGRVILLLKGLMHVSKGETFLFWLVFGAFTIVSVGVLMVVWQALSYLWHVYRTHAQGDDRSARMLRDVTAGVVAVWVASSALYYLHLFGWNVYLNLLLWSYAGLMATLLWAVNDNQTNSTVSEQTSSTVDDYLYEE